MNMRVLLICPIFNSYEEILKQNLVRLGFFVDSVFYNEDEVLRYSVLGKFKASFLYLCRQIFYSGHSVVKWRINKEMNDLINAEVLNSFVLSEFERYCKVNIEHFDKVLIVKGFGLSSNTVLKIKERTKSGGLILYQWDAINRFPMVLSIYPLFDEVFTFQKEDLVYYDGQKYLPSFCVNSEDEYIVKNNKKIDAVFIGVFTVGRLLNLYRLRKRFLNTDVTFYFYLKSRFIELGMFENLIISKKSIPSKEAREIYRSANVIVDLPQSGQTGLTTRVQEAFVMNKKLLLPYNYFSNSSIRLDKDILFIDEILEGKVDLNLIKEPSSVIRTDEILRVESWILRVFGN
jgi:hypothetical protein